MQAKSRTGIPLSLKSVVAVVLILLVTAGSLLIYQTERTKGQSDIVMGNSKAADRVDIYVFVQKVDPVSQTLSAQVQFLPQGALADEWGYPEQQLWLYTNGLKGDTVEFAAGKNSGVTDLQVPLSDGVITDYPFDSYKTSFAFQVETEDDIVPTKVTLSSADAFFNLDNIASEKTGDNTVAFSADIDRSTGTFFFAVFVMLFMWCLSLSAVIAAVYAISGKRGLLWPSMSFMGALLFALVPLRNASPGQPPIGSVIDFGSFFIAEGLISVSLITTVIFGFLTERRIEKEKAAQEAETAPLAPPVGPPAGPELAKTAVPAAKG